MTDVVDIHHHPTVKRDLIAAADLPNTSESRDDIVPQGVPTVLGLPVGYRKWTRPDQAHIAAENIEKLR